MGSRIYRRIWQRVGHPDRAGTGIGQSHRRTARRVRPNLRYPYSSGIAASKHDPLRELRIQHAGRPYRVLYAFDPRRCAILLLGGDKTGNPRWYDEHVLRACRLYDEHLAMLKKEGLLDG